MVKQLKISLRIIIKTNNIQWNEPIWWTGTKKKKELQKQNNN